MEKRSIELKYCLYARKSTESADRQAISIDPQLTEMSDGTTTAVLKFMRDDRRGGTVRFGKNRSI